MFLLSYMWTESKYFQIRSQCSVLLICLVVCDAKKLCGKIVMAGVITNLTDQRRKRVIKNTLNCLGPFGHLFHSSVGHQCVRTGCQS